MLERIRLQHPPIIVALLFFQLVLCSMLAFYLSGLSEGAGGENSSRIYKDITVSGVSLGGLNETEAIEKVQELVGTLNKTPIILTYEGKEYVLNRQNLHVTYDILATVKEAKQISQEMSGVVGLWKWWNNTLPSPNLSVQTAFHRDKAAAFIGEIGRNINQSSTDVIGKVNGDHITLQPERERIQVEVDRTLDRLKEELGAFRNNYRIAVAVKKEPAKLTKQVVGQIDTLLADKRQAITISKQDQVTNLRQAVQSLNGTLLLPGEKFSFNTKVGPFSFDRGYIPVTTNVREASNPDGVAGGASQAASALYVTLIQKGLPVIERHPHLYQVDYASPGLDAFVDGKEIDLRFVNNEKYPVYIHAEIKNNELRVALFGSKNAKKDILIEVKEQKQITKATVVRSDASLPTGQEKIINRGADGLRVKVYTSKKAADGTVKRERLSDDYYRPIPNIIASGPGREGSNEQSTTPVPSQQDSPTDSSKATNTAKEKAESQSEKIKVQGNIIYLN